WGRTNALQLVNNGNDVLFAAGGSTADAALEAAADQGITVIGAETDNYTRLTGIRPELATSAVSDIRSGVRDLIQLAREGKFPSGEFVGQVGLASFHEFEDKIPPDVTTKLDEIINGLGNHSINIDVPYKSQ